MDNAVALETLKQDLRGSGVFAPDENYLLTLLAAAKKNLARQGLASSDSPDYLLVWTGTAAWYYRKRINGEAEPAYLRRCRIDLSLDRGRAEDV